MNSGNFYLFRKCLKKCLKMRREEFNGFNPFFTYFFSIDESYQKGL